MYALVKEKKGLENLYIKECSKPIYGEDEVLIKVGE